MFVPLRSFSYVFVSSVSTDPLIQSTYTPISPEDSVSCMIDITKKQLKTRPQSIVSTEVVKAALQKQIMATHSNMEVTDEMVSNLSMMDLIDTVPLQLHKASNGWIGVNMYVDDQGEAKNLPLNERATAICQACGVMMAVRGDCFISRFRDHEVKDIFDRLDFTLDDLKSGSEFFKQAMSGKCAGGKTDCKKSAKLRCSGCKQISYCSQECQKQHWKSHKPECAAQKNT